MLRKGSPAPCTRTWRVENEGNPILWSGDGNRQIILISWTHDDQWKCNTEEPDRGRRNERVSRRNRTGSFEGFSILRWTWRQGVDGLIALPFAVWSVNESWRGDRAESDLTLEKHGWRRTGPQTHRHAQETDEAGQNMVCLCLLADSAKWRRRNLDGCSDLDLNQRGNESNHW